MVVREDTMDLLEQVMTELDDRDKKVAVWTTA
jgi:hypothetical protein